MSRKVCQFRCTAYAVCSFPIQRGLRCSFQQYGYAKTSERGNGQDKGFHAFLVYSLKQGFVRHKQYRDGNAHRAHHKRRNRAARTHKSVVCKSHQPLKFNVLQHFQQCHHRHRPASNHQPRPWSRLFQTLLRHPHRHKSKIAIIYKVLHLLSYPLSSKILEDFIQNFRHKNLDFQVVGVVYL